MISLYVILLNSYPFQGFLIDGYPMDTEQAESFTKNIAAPNMVILLECNDEILKERLKGR